MPATDNFEMPAGDSITLTFTIETEVEDFDLTEADAVVRWWAAPSVWADEAHASIRKDNDDLGGVVVVDATHFEVILSRADTDELHGVYYHEAEAELGGSIFTLTVGQMTITRTLVR